LPGHPRLRGSCCQSLYLIRACISSIVSTPTF
jgi:hypothetical protein